MACLADPDPCMAHHRSVDDRLGEEPAWPSCGLVLPLLLLLLPLLHVWIRHPRRGLTAAEVLQSAASDGGCGGR